MWAMSVLSKNSNGDGERERERRFEFKLNGKKRKVEAIRLGDVQLENGEK